MRPTSRSVDRTRGNSNRSNEKIKMKLWGLEVEILWNLKDSFDREVKSFWGIGNDVCIKFDIFRNDKSSVGAIRLKWKNTWLQTKAFSRRERIAKCDFLFTFRVKMFAVKNHSVLPIVCYENKFVGIRMISLGGILSRLNFH